MSNQLSWKTGWSGALPPSNFGSLSKVLFKIGLPKGRRGLGQGERETWTFSSREQFWVADWHPALTRCLEKPLSTENIGSLRKSRLLAHCLTKVRLLMLRYFECRLKNKKKPLVSCWHCSKTFCISKHSWMAKCFFPNSRLPSYFHIPQVMV